MGTDEKRRTLIFPPPLVPRPASAGAYSHVPVSVPRPTPRTTSAEVDAAWDAVELISSASVISAGSEPGPKWGRKSGGEAARVPDGLARGGGVGGEASDEDEHPSGRITIPAGAIVAVRASDTITTRPPPPEPDAVRPSLKELALALSTPPAESSEPATEPILTQLAPEPETTDHAMTPSSLPPISLDVRPPMTSAPAEGARSYPVPSFPSPRTAALFAASNLAVGLLVLGTVYVLRPSPKPAKRDARIALDDRVTLGDDVGASAETLGGMSGPSPYGCKVQDLARLIATRAELGPGLDASALESGFGVGLAATTTEAVGVRLDADTLRTAETVRLKTPWPFAHVTVDRGTDPNQRMDVHVDGIFARKGGVFAPDGRFLWAMPGPAPKGNEPIRTSGPVVAVRRAGHFWVGVEGSGPMTALLRPRKQLSNPALAATTEGGVVAWSERGVGPSNVFVATITADGKHTTVSQPALLAEGTSPSIATLPSGELLLTYADGAHRIVAQRLGADLELRGDLLVVSSDVANAAQPAVAVDSEGRAIIAFVAEGHGKPEVHATELLCR